jgi:hypothetical protein
VAAVLNGRTGSGYLLTPRLVLTAAHVVEDRDGSQVTAVRGTGPQDCRVVWRRFDEQCDAALLAADRDLVRREVASRLRPVRWARLSDESPIGDCQVMGFPRAGAHAGHRLDTEHIECALRPGSGMIRDRYVLDIKDVSPELATGKSPWEGMSGAALFAQGYLLGVIVTAPQNWRHQRLEAIKSRVLLDDPGFAEVLARYTPTAPMVTELSAATRHRTSLVLAGVPHSTPRNLGATIRTAWPPARRQFFETMGTPEQPSEGWRNLLTWLRQFDDPATDDIEGRLELIDRWLTNPTLTPDLKLLRLLCWLDPQGAAAWRGTHVTMESLTEACLIGRTERDGPAAQLYEDLCAGGLLDALSGFTELRALRGTQKAWDTACESIRQLTDRLPPRPRQWAEGPARGLLLAAVLPHPGAEERICALSERVTPPAPGVVEWYDWLKESNGDSNNAIEILLRTDFASLASQDAVGVAREAAQKNEKRRIRDTMRAVEEKHDREWAAYEARRLSVAGRLGALLKAAVWIAEWYAVLTAVTWLEWGFPQPAIARAVSWHLAAFTLAAFAGRIPRTLRLGAAYRPPLWMSPRTLRRVRMGSVKADLFIVGLVITVPVVAGVLAHDLGSYLTAAYLVLVMIWVFRNARSGTIRDWNEEHLERLCAYTTWKRGLPEAAEGVKSPSPRVRADAYRRFLEHFAGPPHGGEGPPEEGRL